MSYLSAVQAIEENGGVLGYTEAKSQALRRELLLGAHYGLLEMLWVPSAGTFPWGGSWDASGSLKTHHRRYFRRVRDD